jgi:hypothetical protein
MMAAMLIREGAEALEQFAKQFVAASRALPSASQLALVVGILKLWDEDVVEVSNVIACASILNCHTNEMFKITFVYGPNVYSRDHDFFTELIYQKPANGKNRLLPFRDFNQI